MVRGCVPSVGELPDDAAAQLNSMLCGILRERNPVRYDGSPLGHRCTFRTGQALTRACPMVGKTAVSANQDVQ